MKIFVNSITVSRMLAALGLLIVPLLSPVFWLLYCLCGISDMADGFFARKLHQETEFGAKLDSIADAVFFVCAAVAITRIIPIPLWLWLCIVCALTLRLTAYGLSLIRYRRFVSVHTYANKVTGALLFFSPLLVYLLGLVVTEIIASIAAILSAAEELAIAASYQEPQWNRKSLFRR